MSRSIGESKIGGGAGAGDAAAKTENNFAKLQHEPQMINEESRSPSYAVADLRGSARDAAPPPWHKISSFSWSFWEKLAK